VEQAAAPRELREERSGAIDRGLDAHAITEWNDATHNRGPFVTAPELEIVRADNEA